MRFCLCFCLVSLFSACASKESSTETVQVRRGLEKFNGGYELSKTGEGGQVMTSSKRSQFEKKMGSNQKRKIFKGKKFSGVEYEASNFSGATNKAKTRLFKDQKSLEYETPHFAKNNARLGKSQNFQQVYQQEGAYQTNSAYEQGRTPQSKKLDSRVEKRRKVYQEPRMDLLPSQGRDLSVQDTNHLLGR